MNPSVQVDESINLDGYRILVAEDDSALAVDLCDHLRSCGATVLGPAPTSFYAYHLLMGRRGVDGAVLDIHLHGHEVYGLAHSLRQRGVPIVFATNSGDPIHSAFQDTPRLNKPFALEELARTLNRLVRAGIPQSAELPEPEPVAVAPQLVRPDLSQADRLSRAVARAMRISAHGS